MSLAQPVVPLAKKHKPSPVHSFVKYQGGFVFGHLFNLFATVTKQRIFENLAMGSLQSGMPYSDVLTPELSVNVFREHDGLLELAGKLNCLGFD